MMKKYLTGLLYLTPLIGVAQPVMTHQAHGLQPGTTNTMQEVFYVDPGNGGAQALWDFSAAVATGQPAVTETVALSNDGYSIVVTNATGSKFTYTCDAKGNRNTGYRDAYRILTYDDPIEKITYPFSYGSSISGRFSTHTSFPGSDMGRNQPNPLATDGYVANTEHRQFGSYSSEADGYGTLVMPGGRVLKNVLRIKTIEKYVEETCQTAEVETVKYLWYIEEYRYPVFVTWDINYAYADGNKTTSQASFYTLADFPQSEEQPVYEPDFTAKSGNTNRIHHAVYPNPYSDYFHITYTLEKPTVVRIALYSLAGVKIGEIVDGEVQNGVQHITYTPRNETTGTYYLRLQFDEHVYVRAILKN